MNFTIGLGLLLPDDVSNSIKKLELAIGDKTNNFEGMIQPPHITVKRPFEISSKQQLDEFIEQLKSHTLPALDPLTYANLDFFGNSTSILTVQMNESLMKLHQDILAFCASFNIIADEFEGPNAIFHTTIAMQVAAEQLPVVSSLVAETAKILYNNPFRTNQIGVFMQLPNYGTWVVVDSLPLESTA